MKFLFIISLSVFVLNANLLAQSDSTVVKPVEKMPSFPGGQEAMYKYIFSVMKYPVEARKYKVSGTVYTQFVVSAEGELQDIKVIRGIGFGCDEECIRVVESMNKDHRWIPGTHNGLPVPVKFTLPLKFTLQ